MRKLILILILIGQMSFSWAIEINGRNDQIILEILTTENKNLIPYYSLARLLYFDHQSLQQNTIDRNFITTQAKIFTGDNPLHIDDSRFDPEGFISIIRIYPGTINGPKCVSIMRFQDGEGRIQLDNTPHTRTRNAEEFALLSIKIDPNNNPKMIRTWSRDAKNELQSMSWFDPESGGLSDIVYVTVPAKTLEEIYSHLTEEKRKEIIQKGQDPNNTLITILDSGIDYNHPGIASQIYREAVKFDGKIIESRGWDFEQNDPYPYDHNFRHTSDEVNSGRNHGTHVAGIALGGSSHLSILPLRFPVQDSNRFYDAIVYASERGSKIVNISLGNQSDTYWNRLGDAIKDHPHMLFVIAAGNDSTNIDQPHGLPYLPASFDYPNMLVVTSVDLDGKLSWFSNTGPVSIDIAGLGNQIESFVPDGKTAVYSGTSMATPFITHIAAELLHADPTLDVTKIKEIIIQSCVFNPNLVGLIKYPCMANKFKALEKLKNQGEVNTSP